MPPAVDQIARLKPPASVKYRLVQHLRNGQVVIYPPPDKPAFSCSPDIQHPVFVPQGKFEIVFLTDRDQPIPPPPAVGPGAWIVTLDRGVAFADDPNESPPASAAPPPSQPAIQFTPPQKPPDLKEQLSVKEWEERVRAKQNLELRDDVTFAVRDIANASKDTIESAFALTQRFQQIANEQFAQGMAQLAQIRTAQEETVQRERDSLELVKKELEQAKKGATAEVVATLGTTLLQVIGQIWMSYVTRPKKKRKKKGAIEAELMEMLVSLGNPETFSEIFSTAEGGKQFAEKIQTILKQARAAKPPKQAAGTAEPVSAAAEDEADA